MNGKANLLTFHVYVLPLKLQRQFMGYHITIYAENVDLTGDLRFTPLSSRLCAKAMRKS